MNKIPMLEKFAAQSLVESDGELIFSKERFTELIVKECADIINSMEQSSQYFPHVADAIKEHFGVE